MPEETPSPRLPTRVMPSRGTIQERDRGVCLSLKPRRQDHREDVNEDQDRRLYL